jgi:NAD(P)-dependent dehydrogenase (short-subunit alcohol dehydrogenase family)
VTEHPKPTGWPGASLKGETALVTGASSGIGLAVATLLAQSGACVHGLARRVGPISQAAAELPDGRLVPHRADVTNEVEMAGVAADIGDLGPIHIVVCAAGTNIPARELHELTPESWDTILATNLSGSFYAVHACLPHLPAEGGRVILIASVSGAWPDASGAAYQASKAGIIGFSRGAGLEAHERGIRFSTVLPGMVDTPMQDRRREPPPDEIRAMSLDPIDVAHVCLFLATLPPAVHIPELTILPTKLQALGTPPRLSPSAGAAT